MGFLEILMTVCAIANANLCEDRRIIVDPDMSISRCVMTAQPTMAQWASENPGWTIIRWHCGYGAREPKKT
jgi:hypothetical protein